jgi:hypothetical protein
MIVNALRLGVVGSLLVLTLVASPVAAAQQPPALPHAFFGTLEVNGAPAPAGTKVEARGTGVRTEISGNPIATTEKGKYGGASLYEAKLVVQGSIEAGDPIEFFVNGTRAECAVLNGTWRSSYPFRSGDVTRLLLRVGAGAATSDTLTPTATPSRIVTSESSPTTEATATPRPAAGRAAATPTVRPTRTSTAVAIPTQPAGSPPPQAATNMPVPVAVLASPTVQPATEPAATLVATTVFTPLATTVAIAPATSLTPTSMPTQTPVVVAQRAKATARPILAPATPLPEAQPTAGPSTGDAPPRSLMLWLGVAVLGLAAFGGIGIVIYNRIR